MNFVADQPNVREEQHLREPIHAQVEDTQLEVMLPTVRWFWIIT
jgi:hypothetical protein